MAARSIFSLVLFLVACLTAVAVSVEASFVVRMVQVAHRHGARNPFVTDNTSQICGSDYPCGELTSVGIDMMAAVGRFVRTRYSDPDIVEAPLFPSSRYNSSLVYARSTSTQRTLQSSAAFLRGLFPDDAFYPVIYSQNATIDTLLNTDTVPSVIGRRWLDVDVLRAAVNPVLDAHLTWAQIQAAAKEGFVEGVCANYDERVSCVDMLYDIAISFEASGRLSAFPHLASALPALKDTMTAWYRFIYDYNRSAGLDRIQGAPAQNLAQTIVANINHYKQSPTFKLYEFSTHDTMLISLGVTFGDHSDQTMLPPYAATIIVELLQNTDNADEWLVRVLRGAPVQNDEGEYTFQTSGINVQCMSAAGTLHAATSGTCPLTSFHEMVDASRPSFTNGQCMISFSQYDNMSCPRSIAEKRPVPFFCWIYRHVCPHSACRADYVLAHQDYQCYPNADAMGAADEPIGWSPRMRTPGKGRAIPMSVPYC